MTVVHVRSSTAGVHGVANAQFGEALPLEQAPIALLERLAAPHGGNSRGNLATRRPRWHGRRVVVRRCGRTPWF
jgi:hypothetical protein